VAVEAAAAAATHDFKGNMASQPLQQSGTSRNVLVSGIRGRRLVLILLLVLVN
jgi:hypothetical protein